MKNKIKEIKHPWDVFEEWLKNQEEEEEDDQAQIRYYFKEKEFRNIKR